MNILFTGASSHSGHRYVQALIDAGHTVTAALSRPHRNYQGLPARRIALLPAACRQVYRAPFGSAAFMRIIENQPHWDLLCHHTAYVRNYTDAMFDVNTALAYNTYKLPAVLSVLRQHGCRRVMLTGTTAEQGEGGIRNAPALSPYGVSKFLTTAYFKYYTRREEQHLTHFVMSTPIGPLVSESRFTAYLMRCWQNDKTAVINTPDYVRDNIHVSLLAKYYAHVAGKLPARAGFTRYRPSGYAETIGAFTRRYAREMRKRLGWVCAVKLKKQIDFNEPMIRINTQPVDRDALSWSEKAGWDEIADFYRGSGKTASARN